MQLLFSVSYYTMFKGLLSLNIVFIVDTLLLKSILYLAAQVYRNV